MKTLYSLIAAAALLPGAVSVFAQDAATTTPTQHKNKTPELSKAEFERLLAKPSKLLIIDVRRPDEVTKVGGFPVYLSVQIEDLEKRLDWIPKDRTIVTVSNHAARSGRAADLLASKGFKVAGTVGAQTYEEQGGALTKIVPRPARDAAAAANAQPPTS